MEILKPAYWPCLPAGRQAGKFRTTDIFKSNFYEYTNPCSKKSVLSRQSANFETDDNAIF